MNSAYLFGGTLDWLRDLYRLGCLRDRRTLDWLRIWYSLVWLCIWCSLGCLLGCLFGWLVIASTLFSAVFPIADGPGMKATAWTVIGKTTPKACSAMSAFLWGRHIY